MNFDLLVVHLSSESECVGTTCLAEFVTIAHGFHGWLICSTEAIELHSNFTSCVSWTRRERGEDVVLGKSGIFAMLYGNGGRWTGSRYWLFEIW